MFPDQKLVFSDQSTNVEEDLSPCVRNEFDLSLFCCVPPLSLLKPRMKQEVHDEQSQIKLLSHTTSEKLPEKLPLKVPDVKEYQWQLLQPQVGISCSIPC